MFHRKTKKLLSWEILSFTHFNREWSDFTTSLGLRQLVTQPTRVTDTSSTYLYSSNEKNLSNVHVAELGISDHYAIFCNRKVNFSLKKNHISQLNTARSNTLMKMPF